MKMTPMIVQTIYESRARARITEADIIRLTVKAISKNLTNGLTGYLYYDDWRFLHVIEGDSAQVADAMNKITSDPMHSDLKIRLMNRSPTRSFHDWPFGTVSASDMELRRVVKNIGYQDLFQTNVLDTVTTLKRVAGRKYRNMSSLEKRALSDPRLIKLPVNKPNLTEDMLGLRR